MVRARSHIASYPKLRGRRICSLHFDIVCASPEGAQVHRLTSRKCSQVHIIGRDLVFSLTGRHLEQSVAWFRSAEGASPRTKGDLLEITFHTGAVATTRLATCTACQQRKQQTQCQGGPAASNVPCGAGTVVCRGMA